MVCPRYLQRLSLFYQQCISLIAAKQQMKSDYRRHMQRFESILIGDIKEVSLPSQMRYLRSHVPVFALVLPTFQSETL